MKKKVTAILITCMLICIFLLPVSAATLSGSKTYRGTYQNVTYTLEVFNIYGATLTLSGSGEVPGGSSVPWYSYSEQITELNLSGNFTSIGSNAFADYTQLTEARKSPLLNIAHFQAVSFWLTLIRMVQSIALVIMHSITVHS